MGLRPVVLGIGKEMPKDDCPIFKFQGKLHINEKSSLSQGSQSGVPIGSCQGLPDSERLEMHRLRAPVTGSQ